MKIIVTNVARNNVKGLQALLAVTLNSIVKVEETIVTDSYEARWRNGYRYVHTEFYKQGKPERKEWVASLDCPFEEYSPEWHGFYVAQHDAVNDLVEHQCHIYRYILSAECNALDTGLLFRLAHSIGKAYRTASVTVE